MQHTIPNEPNIAWEWLSKIQIAQLLYFRPDLRDEYEAKKKPLDNRDDKVYN